jgi:hypothetical protein
MLSVNLSEVSQETDANGEPAVRTNAQGGKVFVNSISGQEKPALGSAGENLSVLFQLAYHGTPYFDVIDRFSRDYAGTGEGGAMFW